VARAESERVAREESTRIAGESVQRIEKGHMERISEYIGEFGDVLKEKEKKYTVEMESFKEKMRLETKDSLDK